MMTMMIVIMLWHDALQFAGDEERLFQVFAQYKGFLPSALRILMLEHHGLCAVPSNPQWMEQIQVRVQVVLQLFVP